MTPRRVSGGEQRGRGCAGPREPGGAADAVRGAADHEKRSLRGSARNRNMFRDTGIFAAA